MCACVQNTKAQKSIIWAISVLSLISFVFASVAAGHCSFLQQGDDDGRIGLGQFSFESSNEACVRYDEEEKDKFDASFRAGRAFAAMAALCTGINMALVVSMQWCMSSSRTLWLTVRVLCIWSFLCQVFSFAVFNTGECESENNDDFGCTLGAAGIIGAVNTVFLLALIVLSWLVPPPDHPMLVVERYKEGGAGEDINITVVEGPDGEKNITKEVRHADGSVTVTETVEPAEDTQPAVGEGPVTEMEEIEMDEPGETKVSVMEGPNGERTITKEVTHPDGSKTITTTVEEVETTPEPDTSDRFRPTQSRFTSATHPGRYGEV